VEWRTRWSALLYTLLAAVALAGIAMPSSPATRYAVRTVPPPTPAQKAHAQPFPGAAGDAEQVVSVLAPQRRSRRGRLTLWERTAAGAWRQVGASVPVRLGSDGLTATPREGRPATPIGSFRLTRASGRGADPRVRLHYRQLRPGDGWNTAPGPGYNRLGHTGELWAGRNTWARAAVLIDYNVHHPRAGAGSGFFLHVGSGGPTNGCVGVPRAAMLHLLHWLDPARHPRVLIGVAPRS
jgi:L,D-peptidoglycan transpeptidase YkuD (ErfK/YbiS/YcfS/YnhG family)